MINIEQYLRFAIPKKGRLYEKSIEYLEKAGLNYERKQRSDIAISKNHKVALLFLPVKDIPLYVANNTVNLGITGQDVIEESGVDVIECVGLGYGSCGLSLLEPENDTIDLETAQDLKVATTFPKITRDFFLKTYPNIRTEIVELSGSVEIACRLKLADMIVDLVSSGTTMKAAHLKVVKKIMQSESVLITNKQSKEMGLVKTLLERITGIMTAERFALVEYNIKRDNLPMALKHTPGNTSPTILPLEDKNWVAVKAMLAKKNTHEIMDALSQAGAKDILIYHINNCRL